MRTPAWLCQLPLSAPTNPSLARSSLLAVLPADRRAFTWTFALSIVAACSLVVSPETAFGQRGGGGGHVGGGGGGHSSSTVSHAEGAVAAGPAVTAAGARGASANTSSERAGGAMAISSGITPPASAHFGSNAVLTARGDQQHVERAPRNVTIGFPPRSPDEPRISSSAAGTRTTFTGEGNHFWEERGRDLPTVVNPQRAMASVAGPRAPQALSIPKDDAQLASLTKQASRDRNRGTVSLSVDRPGVIGPPHIWPRRKNPPRSTYGAIGFFGFGFGYPFLGSGLGTQCDPLSAEPWALGCDALGYWNGDNSDYCADYDAGMDQTDSPQGTEESSEEPQSVYVPAPESSPRKIGPEKTLVALYMKSGTVYGVTDYWIADGKLHYRPSYGGENTIEMDDLDLQQTVDVNAKSGVNFTLRPRPE
jgi:hypothetical protein